MCNGICNRFEKKTGGQNHYCQGCAKFVNKKYGLANRNAVHHYEDNENYQVDSTAPYAEAVTNFKYEEAKNDLKRPIRIVQFQYVDLIVDEFKRLMATQ